MPLNTVLLLLGLLGNDGLIDHAKDKYGEDLRGISTREVLDLAQRVQQKRISPPLCMRSSKKGYLIGQNDYLCDDFDVLGTDVNFYFDWNIKPKFATKEKCNTIPNFQYVPATRKGDDWLGYASYTDYKPGSVKYFMGYYRPMRTDAGNMDPVEAAQKWKDQCLQLAPDIIQITPSSADCKEGKKKCINGDIEWFHKYFDELKGSHCPPYQFMALTWYGCNSTWMLNYIRKMWEEFHMPIWITEFACIDEIDKVKAFMTETITGMEKTWYVVRYSWSKLRAPGKSNSLLEDDSSTLTSLGELYQQI